MKAMTLPGKSAAEPMRQFGGQWRSCLVVCAETRIFLVTDVQPRKERIIHAISVDELHHHIRCTIAHFKRPLADLGATPFALM